MAEPDALIRLQFQFARNEAERALRTISMIEAELADWGKQEKALIRTARQSEQAVERQNKAFSEQARQVDSATRAQQDYAAALSRTSQAQRTNRTLAGGGLPARNERFDAVSRDVGLAGDVQSNLGALSAISGIEGIAVAGEFAALAEELPRLKEAASALPDVIGAAVRSIGVGGALAGGGLIGGFLALTAVFGELNRAAEERRRLAELEAQALTDAFRFTQNATSEEVQARIAANNEIIESNKLLIGSQRDLFLANVDGAVSIGDALGIVTNINQDARASFDATGEQIDAAREQAEKLSAENAFLTQSLNDGTSAANDLAAATERVADAQAALVDVEIQTRVGLINQEADAVERNIDTIRRQIQVYEQAIASGDLTADQIATYEGQIAQLNAQLGVLEDALPGLQEMEAFNAALERESETRKAATQAALEEIDIRQDAAAQLADIAAQYAADQIAAAQKALTESEKLLDELESEYADLARELAADLTDAGQQARRDAVEAEIDAQRAQRDALRDHLRNLQDIRERDQLREEQLIGQGRAAELADLRRQRVLDIEGANRDFDDTQEDIAQNLTDTTADLRQELSQQREDLIAAYQADRAIALANYQQGQADLQQQLAEEDRVRRQAQRRDLATLQQATQQALGIKQQGYQQELQLASQAAQGFAAIGKALLQQVNAAAQAAKFGGFQSASGTFIPPASGGGGGGVNTSIGNMNFNVSGAGNPNTTAAVIEQKILNTLKQQQGRKK